MRSFSRFRVLPVCVACFLCAASLVVSVRPSVAEACGPETYSARGVIKSIAADRKSMSIAHEKIEGYMAAMTMPFEARSVEQLSGLKAGDKISFSFTATDDGRRLINSVKRE